MSVYLAFSIGPVQTFIAEARRTQDLRFGSYVLAQLAREAVEAVGVEAVIYPALHDPTVKDKKKRSVALPSQLVARFSDEQDAREAALGATAAVRAEWKRVHDAVQGFLSAPGFHEEVWQEQVARFPRTTWVTYDAQESSPAEAVWEVERLLRLRKQLHDFGASSDEGRKCSVCGLRAVVGEPEYWEEMADRFHESEIKASGNEQLCAICATKRFALRQAYEKENYPSTSTMAAVPFIRVLAGHWKAGLEKSMEARREALYALKRASEERFFPPANAIPHFAQSPYLGNPALPLLMWDGDTLFPETFTPTRLKNDYGIDLADKRVAPGKRAAIRAAMTQAQHTTQAFVGVVTSAVSEIAPPTPYYALLQMDGDRMGELLTLASDEAWLRRLSKALARYADVEARHIVEQRHAGRLVYAGGDDVLALVPLDEALAIASELRAAFLVALQPLVENLSLERPPDMSAGIAITHHMSPLEVALRGTREAEKAAKQQYGRGALVVRLVKRSGVPMQMGLQWGPDSREGNSRVSLLAAVQDAFQKTYLSSRFATQLFQSAPLMATLPEEAQCYEVARLLKRHEILTPEGKPPPLGFTAQELLDAMRTDSPAATRWVVAEDWEANQALEFPASPILELAKWVQFLQFLASGGGERGG